MKIQDLTAARSNVLESGSGIQKTKQDMAMEFERIFARQLIQEMTKGLFKSDDKQGIMRSGNAMYRGHIVDTLSEALAKEQKLGMSAMILKHWDVKPSTNPEATTEHGKARQEK